MSLGKKNGKTHCVSTIFAGVEKEMKGQPVKKDGYLVWFGDGEKIKESEGPKSFYDEDENFWMDYEEDEEANAKDWLLNQ